MQRRTSVQTLLAILAVAMTTTLTGGGAHSQERVGEDEVLAAVEKVAPTIKDVSQKLWDLSEVSLLEAESAAYLKDLLKRNEFAITSENTSNVPTAFVAEYGTGQPIIGILLEYDALPGLGNAAVPRKQPREDGVTSGHGCGHNLIGGGSMGAALAIKSILKEKELPGTLRVYGAAAEESEGAKVFMARDGVFDDVDAMLHWHPMDFAHVCNLRTVACTHMIIKFKGKAAHAGLYPWRGRSALDAVEIFTHSVNMMREHIEPTARVQYIITEGGTAVNVVPDHAAVKLTFRGETREQVNNGVDWIKDMAKGAALATQTEGIAIDYFGVHDLLPNTPFAERMQEHYESVGLPEYTAEEQAFARELQEASDLTATGMSALIEDLPNEPSTGGFSDVGDVSYCTPTMGLTVPSMPPGTGVHTWQATACHGMSLGFKSAEIASRVLALTGVDLFTDAELLKQVKADFAQRTKDFTYQSPIPDSIREPSGLPDELRKFGTQAELKETILNNTGDHSLGPHEHGHGHDHDH